MEKVVQAGAIAFRDDDGEPRFLVVNALKDPRHWIFPKGHVEPGEDREAAARRELREEGGVEGDLLGRVGSLSFRAGDVLVEVDYYLMRARQETEPDDRRLRRWCTYTEAMGLLTFEDSRRLLEDAVTRLNDRAGAG